MRARVIAALVAASVVIGMAIPPLAGPRHVPSWRTAAERGVLGVCVAFLALAVLAVVYVTARGGLWRCRVLGWHPHRFRMTTGFDGASMHERCGRCGFEGLVDSQGNLF